MDKKLLRETLEGMDIPPMRLERLNIEDCRWLQRNLGFRNITNPNFDKAMAMLRKIIKESME